MKWDWGNSESPNIYHDPETRKNSVNYRSYLLNQLILEGKKDKSKKHHQSGNDKMPVEYFDYYSLVEPFAGGYYKIDEPLKAQQLLDKLIMKYRENLNYYGKLVLQNKLALQFHHTDIERYRSLLTVMKENGDLNSYNKTESFSIRTSKCLNVLEEIENN
jgi:hypothetical protein